MSDHHISLHEKVSCCQLNDQGKTFLDKQASAFVDFTHIADAVSKEDVAQCKTASNVSENDIYLPFFSSSLTSFSDNAFEDEKIQQKTFFPESIKHIGNSSFKSCTKLKHLSLPNVLSIDDNAFAENQLEDVEIGSTIKRIDSNSFYSSNQTLTSFTADVLSSSLEDVKKCWPFGIADESVIHFNREAEEIIIPPVPSNAKLEVAANVVKHDLHDEGQTYSDDTKLATLDLTHVEGALNAEDITIPEDNVPFVAYFNDKLSAIGFEAFIEFSITGKTVFPDSLLSIGDGAFYGCKQLDLEGTCLHVLSVDVAAFASSAVKSLTFDKIQHIGDEAFLPCDSLTSIEFTNDVQDIGKNAFLQTQPSKLSVKFAVPHKLLRTYANYPWGLSAYQIICPVVDDNVSALTLSNEVIDKNVVNEALRLTMQDAAEITSVVIKSPCTKICLDAFSECISLKSVKIPESVTWIGRDNFISCNDDLKMHFAGRAYSQVMSIPGFPFGAKYKNIIAEDVYDAPETALKLADDIRYAVLDGGGIYYNDISACHLDFSGTAGQVCMTDVDQLLYDNGLERGSKFKTMPYISISAQSIEASAFSNVSGMSEVNFTEKNCISAIGDDAFAGCELCSIPVFENWDMHSIATSPSYPFGLWDDILISSYDMKDVVPFDKPAHSRDSALSSCSFALLRKGCNVVYGSSIAYGKAGNSNLSTLVCKWPVQIYANAFEKCSALTEVDLPEVTALNLYEHEQGYDAFCGIDTYHGRSSSISSVSMPKCTYIGPRVFFEQPNIVSVHLPDVTELDDGVFACQYLRHLDTRWYRTYTYGVEPKLSAISLPKCVRIGYEAFANRPTLCSVDMPMLEECGHDAFACVHNAGDVQYLDECTLTSLSLPSLTAIPGWMLAMQTALVSVYFPKVTFLSEYAFCDCYLTSFDFDNVTKVQCGAFYNSKFKDISISNVEFVKSDDHEPTDYLFFGCEQLTSVTLPPSLTSIGYHMFHGCSNLKKLNIDFSKICYVGSSPFYTYYDTAISYAAQLTSLDMPELTTAEYRAFYKCTGIAYAKMPKLLSVAQSMFDGCTSLTSIELCNCVSVDYFAFRDTGLKRFTVPDSLTSINANAFNGCSMLEDLSVAAGNPVYFSDVGGIHYPAVFKRVDDEHSVIWLATSALSSLPEGIISVDYSTLQSMASVTSFYVPKSLTGELYNLRGLTQLQQLSVHPDNPRYLDLNGSNVIAQIYDDDNEGKLEILVGCSNSRFDDVELGEYIGRICSYAFDSRNEIEQLSICCSSLTCIQPNAIANCMSLTSLTVDTQSKVNFMKNAVTNNPYLTRVNITNASSFATDDDNDAFKKCNAIEELTVMGLDILPSYFCNNKYNMRKLKTDANRFADNSLRYSTALKQFEFTRPVIEAGSYSFAGCKHLTSFADANMTQIQRIGDNAFEDAGLTAIDLPQLEYAGCMAFCKTPVISADLPKLTYSGGSIFADCSVLTAASVPQLTALKDFSYCISLVSVYNISATEINDGAFNRCSSLTRFSSNTVTAVTGYAPFSYCTSLSAIDIPNVKVVGGGDIFMGCTSLSAIDLKNVKQIKDGNVFAECSSLTSLELDNVLSIGQYVFQDSCLKSISLPSCLVYMNVNAFNSQDSQYDYSIGKMVYTWKNRVPDLTAVYVHNMSLNQIYTDIARINDEYYRDCDIQPYWGLDKSIFKLDTKYTSVIKAASSIKKRNLNDGAIAYSTKKVLDLTQKA